MGEERRAFYVVRKGDVIGVYANLADCQAQAGYSPSNPSVTVYKGYGLSKEAEAFLSCHGLKNASYSMAASELRDGLFGSLAVCPFQDASPSSLSSCKSTKEQLSLGLPVNARSSPRAVYSHNNSIKLENHVTPQGPGQNDYVLAYVPSIETTIPSPSMNIFAEVVSLKEEVESITATLRELEILMNVHASRNQGVFLDNDFCGPFPGATLPAGLTISDFLKFDGTTDPEIHLKMYYRIMSLYGASNEAMIHFFPFSLTTAALSWYLTHAEQRVSSWEDLKRVFMNQYEYNTQVDLSRIDLETTYQNPNETFVSFIIRWRKKAAQLVNCPDEKDQIKIIRKNLLPEYKEQMRSLIIVNFDLLIDIGAAIEQAIRNREVWVCPPIRSYQTYNNTSTEPSVRNHVAKLPSCIIEFDGASKGNPGPAGAGAIVRAEDGTAVWRLREGVGIATNNVAEYRGVILGLKYALNRGYKHVRVRGDSLLVCKQIEGLWKTKNQNMADLCGVAKELKNKFVSFRIEQVMREFNAEADAQANKAVNLRDGETEVDFENPDVHRTR